MTHTWILGISTFWTGPDQSTGDWASVLITKDGTTIQGDSGALVVREGTLEPVGHVVGGKPGGRCCVQPTQPGCDTVEHETTALSSSGRGALGVRGVPVPARGDHVGGPLVSQVRPVVPRRRGALGRRGVEVDHVSIYRWVLRFTPLLIDAARPCRHGVGDRWHVDEPYVRVTGEWRYVYRAVDQHGQVLDVFVSPRRDARAAKKFFVKAIKANGCEPAEVVTDKASTYPGVLDELLPGAFHNTVKHANNSVENDHGRLKARLRPMRGLKQDRSARIIIAGHALIQNLRRGHYELGVESAPKIRLAAAFDELAMAI